MAQHIALGALSHKQNQGEVSPSKEMRKLRVQLSDRIFQLKKMEQDCAEQKAHMMIQFNTEKNNLNAIIRELRDKITEENQHWTNKIDQLRLENQQKIKAVNQQWMIKIDNQVSLKLKQTKNIYDLQIAQLKANISKVNETLKQKQKSYNKTISKMKEAHTLQISQLKQSKEMQIQQFKKKVNKDEQMKINAVMYIKNSQQKQHAITKSLLIKKQRQYNQNTKKLEMRIYELKQQVWSLKRQVETLNSKNQQQEQKIQKLEENKKITIQMTNKQYEQKQAKVQKQWKQNLESLNQKWKNQYKKVQSAYQKLYNACIQKQKLWEERGNKVLQLYQRRQAREQDIKLIQHLQVQLIRKQFELQREKQELKSCKLELDNMDDIYKRIFHSVQKNNRQSHSFHLKKMRLPGIMNRSTHPIKGESY